MIYYYKHHDCNICEKIRLCIYNVSDFQKIFVIILILKSILFFQNLRHIYTLILILKNDICGY